MIYRGNVMEVKRDSLVVMLDDCTFEKVKKFKGLEEGMEIYFEERDIIKKSNVNFKSIALIAASILLFIITTFYGVDVWNTNYKAIALVSVDINPSIELKLNKNYNVINAVALNEDAKKLQLKELKNQHVDKALEQLVNMAKVEGYIKEDEENYVLVTSVDLIENVQEDKILNKLIAEGKEKIESSAKKGGEALEVITIKSNKETLKEAKKENISVGKKELDKDADIKQKDNLKDKIKLNKDKALKELKKESKEVEKDLKDLQKYNNKDNDNKRNNAIIKEEKDKLKEEVKQEKNEIKDTTKEVKDKLKEEVKNNKDIQKELKKQKK